MRKMTQAEFDALKRNEIGYLVIPDGTDCTEIDFGAAERVILGYGCKLGDCCKLGDECKLGDCCELGDECKLGERCKLGNRCRLGDGCELGYLCRLGDGCKLGCWCELNDFKTRVKGVHGGTIYEAQYMAACAYAETVLPQMLEESDAARKEWQHDND